MELMDNETRDRLEKTGFRFIGPSMHSAIKTCEWTRKALRGNDYCYKQKFYGIETHRCIQMTPAFHFCTHRCMFCWRDTTITYPAWKGNADEPEQIMEEAIEAQKKILQGFGGNEMVDKKVFDQAMKPNQVAISLAGEPTLYPRLPELIDYIRSRNMTSFLVSNGTNTEMIKKLVDHQPSQLYITLPAPDEKVYKRTCNPLIKDGWERLNESLSLMKEFGCNTVIRLTLVRDLNLVSPDAYAKIIEKSGAKFIEVKSFMSVGYSRQRLPYSSMPLHKEIRAFSEQIEKSLKGTYRIKDEKSDSRVVLLKRI